jgi:ribosomal protein S18 acetylase RimI-like enzyme
MISIFDGYQLINEIELEALLLKINFQFNPALSQSNNLQTFAAKLYEKAHLILASENGVIIGLCAYYDNHLTRSNAFLSLLFVDANYQDQGLASNLLNSMITNLKMDHFKFVLLEVNVANNKAIKLYKTFGFEKISKVGAILTMEKVL